ncbi:hypothetical protein GOBAR_AA37239 [Gossypium barbadense]|uniref:Uncharacterized protein n=1 Tax=Gossypium barbadense TaxID=3634 RepID=A0A2P5VX94_GOSBA|nr:hypothetical protein GOBAR_AA37239 [Gossypium barbadense]
MGRDIGLQMVVIEEDALTVIRKLQKDHTDRSEMGLPSVPLSTCTAPSQRSGSYVSYRRLVEGIRSLSNQWSSSFCNRWRGIILEADGTA